MAQKGQVRGKCWVGRSPLRDKAREAGGGGGGRVFVTRNEEMRWKGRRIGRRERGRKTERDMEVSTSIVTVSLLKGLGGTPASPMRQCKCKRKNRRELMRRDNFASDFSPIRQGALWMLTWGTTGTTGGAGGKAKRREGPREGWKRLWGRRMREGTES